MKVYGRPRSNWTGGLMIIWLAYASWNRGVKGGGFNAPLESYLLVLHSTPSSQDEFDAQYSVR